MGQNIILADTKPVWGYVVSAVEEGDLGEVCQGRRPCSLEKGIWATSNMFSMIQVQTIQLSLLPPKQASSSDQTIHI